MTEIYISWLGVALGALSLLWNVISFFISLNQNRVHLRLVATYALQVKELGLIPNNIRLTWNIANLSPFPIYINSVGFCPCEYPCSNLVLHKIPDSYITAPYETKTDCIFPLRLDSRNAIVLSLADGNQIEEARKCRYMYVSTNCGYLLAKEVPFPSKVFSRPRKAYR